MWLRPWRRRLPNQLKEAKRNVLQFQMSHFSCLTGTRHCANDRHFARFWGVERQRTQASLELHLVPTDRLHMFAECESRENAQIAFSTNCLILLRPFFLLIKLQKSWDEMKIQRGCILWKTRRLGSSGPVIPKATFCLPN